MGTTSAARARADAAAGASGTRATAQRANAADPHELALLLGRTQARCAVSFARLYLLTRPQLLRIVLRINSHHAEAEEVLQEVFANAWLHSGQFDGQRGTAMGWLASMAHNKAVSSLRHRHRRPQAQPIASADADSDPYADIACQARQPLDQLMAWQAATALHACLDALAPAHRDCVTLAFFDGLTHGEIARQLGQPLGTVKSRLRRTMQQMRPALLGH